MIRKAAAYGILGINEEGHKEVLSITIGENESAKYWLGVLNELKNRGVQDIFVICADGLSGIREAILFGELFPMRQQEAARALEVFPLGIGQMLLHLSADVIQGPNAIANHMEAVDDDPSVGEDVKNALRQRIGDDALKSFSAGVAFELVERDGRRDALGTHRGHVPEAACDTADGGAVRAAMSVTLLRRKIQGIEVPWIFSFACVPRRRRVGSAAYS